MFRGELYDDDTTYTVEDDGVGLGGDRDLDATTH